MTLRRFTSIVASLMMAILAFGQENPGARAADQDERRIQGPWQPVQIEMGGKQGSDEQKNFKMLFLENKFLLAGEGGNRAIAGTFKLDAKKEPGTIDLELTRIDKGEVMVGIYQFQDNQLVLCLTRKGEPRPTKFESKAGSKSLLITLKKGTAADKKTLTKQLAQALAKPGYSAKQTETFNNLRNIGFALHQYHADNNTFPVPIVDKKGKPLLSWRVAILSYLEEQDLGFKLDEPWDSKHNIKLLAKMPKVFSSPHRDKEKNPTSTYFVGFKGPGGVLGGPKGIRITSITNNNGAAKTILVAEARDPVPWTKPADIEFTLKKPLPPLGNPETKQIIAVFADAHIQRLPIDFKHLKRAIQYTNRKPFELP